MKNLKNLSKRSLAVLLAVMMCVGMLSLPGFAAYTGLPNGYSGSGNPNTAKAYFDDSSHRVRYYVTEMRNAPTGCQSMGSDAYMYGDYKTLTLGSQDLGGHKFEDHEHFYTPCPGNPNANHYHIWCTYGVDDPTKLPGGNNTWPGFANHIATVNGQPTPVTPPACNDNDCDHGFGECVENCECTDDCDCNTKKITVTFKDGYSDSTLQTVNGVKERTDGNYTDLFTEETPERTGYTFTGWDNGTTDASGNVTYEAQWTQNPCNCDDHNSDDCDCGGAGCQCKHVHKPGTPEDNKDGETHDVPCEDGDGNYDEKVPHNWVPTGTTPATCTEKGSKTYKCECGATKTETTEALGHDYEGKWQDDPTDHANHYRECTRNSSHVKESAAHNYGGWTIDKYPEGDQPGVQKRTCEDCGHEQTREFVKAAQGHNWKPEDQGDGTHQDTCTDPNCDETRGDPEEHTWDEGEVTVNPTCTENGEKKLTCTKCGATKTESIDPTGHAYPDEWTEDTENGGHYRVCGNDERHVDREAAHNWSDWKKISDTEHQRTCTKCSATETKEHSWNEDTGKCDDCGAVREYTVTFISEGETVKTETVKHGDTIEEPTVTRAGYTFNGWDSEVETTVTKDATYTAKWVCNGSHVDRDNDGVCDKDDCHVKFYNYTLVYVVNADNVEGPRPVAKFNKTTDESYSFTLSTVEKNQLIRKGYEFKGWAATKDGAVIEDNTITATSSNPSVIVYAVWVCDGHHDYDPETGECTKENCDMVKFTLTYDANGGENAPAGRVTESKNNSVNFILAMNGPVRDGYEFRGWARTKDATPDDVIKNKIVVRSGNPNVTVYAVWVCNGHHVDRDNDGECDKEGCHVQFYNYTLIYLVNADNVEGPRPAAVFKKTTEESNSFTLSTVENNKLTRDGYVFMGWAKTPDGTPDDVITTIDATIEEPNVIVYAVWVDADPQPPMQENPPQIGVEKHTYTLTYVTNGGTMDDGAEDSVTSEETYATSYTFTLDASATRDGYEFLGWSATEDGTGTIVTITATSTDKDKTVYAVWKCDGNHVDDDGDGVCDKDNCDMVFHKVTFEPENGEDDFTQSVQDGEKATEPSNPQRNGYTFKGWYDEDGNEYDFDTEVKEDITLHADWTRNTTTRPTTPTPDPEPTPEPTEPDDNGDDDEIDIPEDDVPLAPGPVDDGDDGEFDIPEDDVPLSPGPVDDGDDDLTDVPEDDVPLAPGPVDDGDDGEFDIPEDDVPLSPGPVDDGDDGEFDIPEDDVPLASVPQTGDDSHIWGYFALISGAGLALLVLKNKKREDAAE